MARVILAVDVGNIRMKVGAFQIHATDDRSVASQNDPHFDISQIECRGTAAFNNDDAPDWETIRGWLKDAPGSRSDLTVQAIVAGSNPKRIQSLLRNWPDNLPQPEVADDYRKFPLDVCVDFPERVGIDRLLNAVAVHHLQVLARPAIIVDSGTATTVDVIDAAGAFQGGAILPGFELASRALHQYTQLLPKIDLPELAVSPPAIIGKNTTDAIKSGLFWGEIGAIEKIITRQQASLDEPAQLILTGGSAPLINAQLELEFHHIPNLALYGLLFTATTEGKSR